MGKLSKDTIKKIALLYTINKAKKAIYSNFRLQKILYFCTKDSETKPFTFKHTENGQYSFEVAEIASELEEIGFVKSEPLDGEHNGLQWSVNNKKIANEISILLESISSDLKGCIDDKFDTYQYLKQKKLDKVAHSDEDLLSTPFNSVIFYGNLPEFVDVDIPDDEIDDLELAFNSKVISAIRELFNKIENNEIDNIEQWIDA